MKIKVKTVIMEKSALRKHALDIRNSLSEVERRSKSDQIKSRLESTELFRNSKNILLYLGHGSEVETLGLIGEWMKEKNFFLPRLTSSETFMPVRLSSLDDLKPNIFGIPEPASMPDPSDPPIGLDLILVPGVAFDRSGNRIGMGKGFYDRFLAEKKGIPKVALAYSEQILDQLHKEPYDEKVDWILTEKETIRCHF